MGGDSSDLTSSACVCVFGCLLFFFLNFFFSDVEACSVNLVLLPCYFGVDGKSKLDILFRGSVTEDKVSGPLMSAATVLPLDYLCTFIGFMV